MSGYEYHPGEQPYYLEIWVEKTTINEILTPICERYGINLVTSAGFQSITAAVDCLSRAGPAIECDRPVRILYISDFDPAGAAMPRAVARQLEFWREVHDVDADIKLTSIALTQQQVERYNLPRTPIKQHDARKATFEECFGEGAVELDALEALHPGELAKIVTEAVAHYRDDDLEFELSCAGQEAEQTAQDEWEDETQPIRERAKELKARSQVVFDKYTPELEKLRDAGEADMAPIREELEAIEDDLRAIVDGANWDLGIDLPDRPVAQINKPDESRRLFDSHRADDEQLAVYQKYSQGRL